MDLKQNINKYFLEDIIKIAIEKALFISNIVFKVSFISQLNDISKFYVISIKLL